VAGLDLAGTPFPMSYKGLQMNATLPPEPVKPFWQVQYQVLKGCGGSGRGGVLWVHHVSSLGHATTGREYKRPPRARLSWSRSESSA